MKKQKKIVYLESFINFKHMHVSKSFMLFLFILQLINKTDKGAPKIIFYD